MTEETAPANINPLYQDKFRLVLERAKNVEFFTSKLNLPGISQQVLEIPNPLNFTYAGGTKIQYEEFTLNFRVDENLVNYMEIHNWIIGIAAPQTTDQHKDIVEKNNRFSSKTGYFIYSDATLFSLTNAFNANVKVFFKDLFPVSLSALDMDIESSSTMNASARFRYNWYDINPKS